MFLKSVCLSSLLITPAIGLFYLNGDLDLELPQFEFGTLQHVNEVPAEDQPAQVQRCFASGVIEGSQREVPLRFELEGRLTEIRVAENEKVTRGQVLARLDDAVWRHEFAQAKASLARARAEKQRLLDGATKESLRSAKAEISAAAARTLLARNNLKRSTELFQGRIATREDFEADMTEYRVARSNWLAARARYDELEAPPRKHELKKSDSEIALASANLSRAKTMLLKTVIRAPTDGVILRVDGELGELAGPQSEVPLIRMVRCDRLRVRAYIEELDAVHIRQGQRAQVTADGLQDVEFPGAVVSCLPSMQAKRQRSHRPEERLDVKVREVLIEIDPSPQVDQLVLGLPVDVFVELDRSQPIVSPPETPQPALPIENRQNRPPLPTQYGRTKHGESPDIFRDVKRILPPTDQRHPRSNLDSLALDDPLSKRNPRQ